jgi:hypothetical protein
VESVRVQVANGAPRIVVDGQPVRGRVFFGIPETRPVVPTTAAGGPVSFEFTARDDEPQHATMHFRFGRAPGEVWLDDLHVTDLTAGKEMLPLIDFAAGQSAFDADWRVWPPAAENTVGLVRIEPDGGAKGSAALHVTIKPADEQRPQDFHVFHRDNQSLVKGHRYRVSFWARSTPARNLQIGFYRPGKPYVDLGGPDGVYEKQIRMAANVGVDLVSFPIETPWPKEGESPNWASIDTACEQVLSANPQALLLPRLGASAPAWWIEAHPNHAMRWDDGPHHRQMAAVASPEYRHAAAERVAAAVSHIEAKFGPRVAGYHPCGQNTGEWFYEDTWKHGLNGYAPVELTAWRAWLKERYHDPAKLRAAWRNVDVDFETADVPTSAVRRAAPFGLLRDPATERSLIDFAEFQQQMMADCMLTVARATRQASRGQKLVLIFYGYLFEFGTVPNTPGTAGHYALRRVLDSPDIDVLCSPISYFDRGLGGGAPSMTVAESVALAGKMWLNEDDTATYLSSGDAPGSRDRVTNVAETNEELARNVAQASLRNFATWWMDLGASGWFNDEKMWALMQQFDSLDKQMLAKPTAFRPQVAAVVDDRSVLRVAAGGQAVTGPALTEARRALGRMGAPYGQYLQDDVAAGRVDAKLYVFLTAWLLDPDERRRLLEATRGKTRLWLYAPAYHEEHSVSLDAMRELTGFRLQTASEVEAWATPTDAGRKLGLTAPFGVKRRLKPLFSAADATPEETLARYADGSAAVALRRGADGVSLFVGPPALTSELLRLAAREAGAHLYTDADCNVWANGPCVTLHGSQSGPIKLDLGRSGALRDLLSGEKLGSGLQVSVPLDRGQTRVLLIDDK